MTRGPACPDNHLDMGRTSHYVNIAIICIPLCQPHQCHGSGGHFDFVPSGPGPGVQMELGRRRDPSAGRRPGHLRGCGPGHHSVWRTGFILQGPSLNPSDSIMCRVLEFYFISSNKQAHYPDLRPSLNSIVPLVWSLERSSSRTTADSFCNLKIEKYPSWSIFLKLTWEILV
mgnify:FL=1